MPALEAHETITARQQREPLGIDIGLVGRQRAVFVAQPCHSSIGETSEPPVSVEYQSRLEQDAEIPDRDQPVGPGDLEIGEAVQLVRITGAEGDAARIVEVADRGLRIILRIQRDGGALNNDGGGVELTRTRLLRHSDSCDTEREHEQQCRRTRP